MVREDRSILDFLDADFTFVNERLAQHYGIAGVRGDEFRRRELVRHRPRRRADPGERTHRHLEPDADLAGQARAVGARQPARLAAARRRRPGLTT